MTDTRKPSAENPADSSQPVRGKPGSFDQPESHPETMPREGGPRPEQTADVPLGTHGAGLPMGARGHNSPPVQKKETTKETKDPKKAPDQ
jgi:hypothetical protein